MISPGRSIFGNGDNRLIIAVFSLGLGEIDDFKVIFFIGEIFICNRPFNIVNSRASAFNFKTDWDVLVFAFHNYRIQIKYDFLKNGSIFITKLVFHGKRFLPTLRQGQDGEMDGLMLLITGAAIVPICYLVVHVFQSICSGIVIGLNIDCPNKAIDVIFFGRFYR